VFKHATKNNNSVTLEEFITAVLHTRNEEHNTLPLGA
jgi:hypothetical protein